MSIDGGIEVRNLTQQEEHQIEKLAKDFQAMATRAPGASLIVGYEWYLQDLEKEQCEEIKTALRAKVDGESVVMPIRRKHKALKYVPSGSPIGHNPQITEESTDPAGFARIFDKSKSTYPIVATIGSLRKKIEQHDPATKGWTDELLEVRNKIREKVAHELFHQHARGEYSDIKDSDLGAVYFAEYLLKEQNKEYGSIKW